jgi:hypothetical protein
MIERERVREWESENGSGMNIAAILPKVDRAEATVP